MQLLYGNDRTNYCIISKSFDMSDMISDSIVDTYLGYDFVKNKNKYIEEPYAITYLTSNLNDNNKKYLVIGKSDRIKNISTTSYYMHFFVQQLNHDFFKSNFMSLFNYKFIEYEKIEDFSCVDIDDFPFKNNIEMDEEMSVKLSKEQLIVILSCFMANEEDYKKTRIFVDDAQNYNKRSMEILSSIYHYLSPTIREKYGFRSYCTDLNYNKNKISFLLYSPYETKDSKDIIKLTDTVDMIRNRVDQKYINYANYLVKELTDEELENYFHEIDQLGGDIGLTITDCVSYFLNKEKWENGTQEQYFKDWLEFNNSFYSNSPDQKPIYQIFLNKVKNKVSQEFYNNYLYDVLTEVKLTNISSNLNLKKCIKFANRLNNVYVDKNLFMAWFSKQYNTEKNQLSNNCISLFDFYNRIINKLQAFAQNVNSREVFSYVQEIINEINVDMEECKQDIDELKEQELENKSSDIYKFEYKTFIDFNSFVDKILLNLKFSKDNLEAIINTVFEKINNIATASIDIKELSNISDMIKNLKEKYSISESNQNYLDCKQVIDSKIEEFRELMLLSNIDLGKHSVLMCYNQLLKNKDNIKFLNISKVSLVKDAKKVELDLDELIDILSFAMDPNENDLVHILNHFDILVEYELLHSVHFKYFLECRELTEKQLKTLIQYYFEKEEVEISGSFIGKKLKQYHADKVDSVLANIKDCSNIEYEHLKSEFKKEKGIKKFLKR